LAVILTAQVMITLDSTITTIAVPPASRALHISVANSQWMLTAYTLAFGSLLLLGGRIADYLGRKRILIWSLVGFGLASALGGLAQDQAMLFAARGLQGAMGALMAPAALSILTVTFTEPHERHRAFGMYGAVSGGGAGLGLILGGVLTQYVSWRWNLLITAPLAVLAALAAAREVHESRSDQRSGYDIPGAATSAVGLLALVYGFTRAQSNGWASGLTLACLFAGGALLVIFTLVETRVANPLLPLRVVLERARGVSFLAIVLVGLSTIAAFLFLTFYLQQIRHYSALKTGLLFFPISVATVVGATIATQLMARIKIRTLLAAGFAVSTAGMAIFTQIGVHSSFPALLLPAEILWAVGFGMVFVVLSNTSLIGVAPNDAGVASALVNTTQQVGTSIGVALLSTIAASAGSSYLTSHHGAAAQVATVHGYSIGFAISAALIGAAGIICILFLRPGRAEATNQTETIAI
jgi:EmrB/QacA subfamily drug resistance transporter